VVDSENLSTVSICSVMIGNHLEVLSEDVESELVLFFGSIGFTVLSNVVVKSGLGFSINLEKLGGLGGLVDG